jgi:hypothetical protein
LLDQKGGGDRRVDATAHADDEALPHALDSSAGTP